ncbi:cytochrome c biogenesis protein CcdA [Propioniciclava sp. MC1595]|uniref:cytochrome c biogenesis CcdA family protein n=1 Tax=unclassified Propioniciclava TaxID=2642922 RepID=UPI001603AB6F|nr:MULTISPECIES: cytochrome c biogenesis protein CcdA [unclassified Propioniciclava]MBB1495554.1 cytochrome c biogenesis protein CcdA [Propioniciclava sp. MC1595]MBB1502125.1 cytochrome c biogenesis protein CcdA [Propioniciclava sp. MC1683]NLE17758.1 cytochrome c biogenesis protein CcdA [Propioniciclava sp.]QTE25647.1 cytochrome c biogenesis protein CcdA [Propioniciclava sp. MC1595]
MVEVGLAVAFVAGVATFASPCCLPMVPVWIGYIVGGTPAGQRTNRLVALQQSLAFVVGFAVVFVGLWASIGLVGYLLRGYVDVIRQVAGVLLIVMGLHVAGLITIPFLRNQVSLGGRLVRRDASGAVVATRPSVLRSALFGVVFAAGWTPCVGPTLGAIIGMASLNDTFGQGTLLLVVFALGLGLPFVLVALGADAVRQRLAWLTNHQVIVSVVTGALLMVVGFLMLTNLFARLAQFTPQFPV